MYDRRVLATTGEWVRAWKPAVPGIHEVFHARFVDHAYPPHTHDAWTVFIVDEAPSGMTSRPGIVAPRALG